MGLFKQASLRYRAHRIAKEFSKLRYQQFDSTVRSIEPMLGNPAAITQRTLGGDADRALKGYQLFIATAFFAEHHNLIPDSEYQEFGTYLSMAVIGSIDERALDYFKEFAQYAKDPVEQVVQVSFHIAKYITSDSDPIAASITAQLLPIFIVNSQMVVASVFGDHKAVSELESEIESIRRALTGT